MNNTQQVTFITAWNLGFSDDMIARNLTEVSEPWDPWNEARVKRWRIEHGYTREQLKTINRERSHQKMPAGTDQLTAQIASWPATGGVRRFPQ